MAGCRCLVFSQDAPLVIIRPVKAASKVKKYKEFISGKAKEAIKGRMNIRVSNKGSIVI